MTNIKGIIGKPKKRNGNEHFHFRLLENLDNKNMSQSISIVPRARKHYKMPVKRFDPTRFKGSRGGIILYCNGKYILGLDSKHNELTDFGGQKDHENDKTILHTALREFLEETNHIIPLSMEDVMNGYAYFTSQCLIIKINVHINEHLFQDYFQRIQSALETPSEISQIIVLTEHEFILRLHDSQSSYEKHPFPFYHITQEVLQSHYPLPSWYI